MKIYTARSPFLSIGEFLFSIRFIIENPIVRTPTRPIYIKIIRTNFPASVRVGVIPVVRPTVPRAEADSKRYCTYSSLGSTAVRI